MLKNSNFQNPIKKSIKIHLVKISIQNRIFQLSSPDQNLLLKKGSIFHNFQIRPRSVQNRSKINSSNIRLRKIRPRRSIRQKICKNSPMPSLSVATNILSHRAQSVVKKRAKKMSKNKGTQRKFSTRPTTKFPA